MLRRNIGVCSRQPLHGVPTLPLELGATQNIGNTPSRRRPAASGSERR
jgi:hypothetical protein